ncbi:MAG TPA: hypothetical protein PLF42_00215 [Anaerolineales bacterium]|nr:hypothetical protein [Anaerolineales bacterium]
MLKRAILFLLRAGLAFAGLAAVGLFVPMFIVQSFAAPRTFGVEDVPPARVAIVFGAGAAAARGCCPTVRLDPC